MKKFRMLNWLVLVVMAVCYATLEWLEAGAFWQGVILGAGGSIFFAELIWIVKGRDLKNYPLRSKS